MRFCLPHGFAKLQSGGLLAAQLRPFPRLEKAHHAAARYLWGELAYRADDHWVERHQRGAAAITGHQIADPPGKLFAGVPTALEFDQQSNAAVDLIE